MTEKVNFGTHMTHVMCNQWSSIMPRVDIAHSNAVIYQSTSNKLHGMLSYVYIVLSRDEVDENT